MRFFTTVFVGTETDFLGALLWRRLVGCKHLYEPGVIWASSAPRLAGRPFLLFTRIPCFALFLWPVGAVAV